MNANTVYAVIDLETTGPDAAGGDRIIQFGCALVKNHQVIQTLSQLINPDRPIPQAIQALTGITPEMLTAAPYFDEVAPAIAAMLKGTVVVAHNVNFDYPFLSHAFVAAGLPALTNQAIDTVQLAQVILPTAQSYRLSDLTRELGIVHDNPHRADSDAISTGKLMLALMDRFAQLPGPTQRLIAAHADFMIRDTDQLLKQAAAQAPKLTGRFLKVEDLVLRVPLKPGKADPAPTAYPATDKAKRQALRKAKLRFRFAQAKMMDCIYNNAQTNQRPLFIEAGTGLGKSLGYLLPYAYVANPQRKLIVATATTVLQDQLATKTANQLTAILGAKPKITVLKSPRHLLDLAKFAATLNQTQLNKADRLLQLRILVWLTQTRTGDLDELHVSEQQTPLLAQIRHTGDCGDALTNPFYAVDFFVRLQERASGAAIIVTNHAYLIHHYDDPVFSNQPYLVVDEAQHFPDNARRGFEIKLDLTRMRRGFQHLSGLLRQQSENSLLTIYEDDALMRYQLASTGTVVQQLLELVQTLQQYYASRYLYPRGQVGEVLLTADELNELILSSQDDLTRLASGIDQIIVLAHKLRQDYLKNRIRFTDSDTRTFQQLDEISTSLQALLPALRQVLDQKSPLLNPTLRTAAVWMRHKNDVSSLVLRWHVLTPHREIQTLMQRFTAPVFTSATLTVRKTVDYLAAQLGYPNVSDDQQLRLRSPFKYRELAKVMIAKGAPEPPKSPTAAYADFIASSVKTIANGKQQTLVLFNSLAMIAAVYERLMGSPLAQNKEILAQGVTGSNAKISRRFAAGDNTVLLGAASFFEGIDFPAKQLECIILTRLPFNAPTDESMVSNPANDEPDNFDKEVLPRATLRFRQAFGRLIRTENDRGVFVVLDPRLTTTTYGRSMQRALPSVDTDLITVRSMPPRIAEWLEPITPSQEEVNHD